MSKTIKNKKLNRVHILQNYWNNIQKSWNSFIIWWRSHRRRLVSLFLLGVSLGLALLFDWATGQFLPEHAFLVLGVYVFYIVLHFWKRARENLLDLFGMESFTLKNIDMVKVEMVAFIGLIFSLYLITRQQTDWVSPVFDFSMITVSANLGGLVIAGAGYSKILPFRRVELLRVAQKLIIASILFMFFTAIFFFVQKLHVDPNIPAWDGIWGGEALIRGGFYWFSVICLFLGVILFMLGMIELAFELVALKKDKNSRDA